MKRIDLSGAPANATPTQRRNFLNVQADAIGIGISSAAGSFLAIFLTRLGATNLQIGLLTAMPGVTGFFLAFAAGQFLESRRNIIPWYSAVRLINISAYTLTGLVPFFVPREHIVPAVLVIWALITFPQTLSNVAFSVVMNAVAGPKNRYRLMSRRWSLLGLVNAVMVAIVGQVLDRLSFPTNYQWVFICLSSGGLIAYYFTSRVKLPDREPALRAARFSAKERIVQQVALVRGQRAFFSFVLRRFVYLAGTALAAPLFPLYFVREVNAPDSWIGIVGMVQMAMTLVGYYLWAWQARARNPRFMLLATTIGSAAYPLLVAVTHRVEWIAVFAGLAGLFQAGRDLVFFDELMSTVPPEHGPTFVSVAQNIQFPATVAAPLLGTLLADRIGLGGGLLVSAVLSLVGCLLFALMRPGKLDPGASGSVKPHQLDGATTQM